MLAACLLRRMPNMKYGMTRIVQINVTQDGSTVKGEEPACATRILVETISTITAEIRAILAFRQSKMSNGNTSDIRIS
jgi:hypothetical protein